MDHQQSARLTLLISSMLEPATLCGPSSSGAGPAAAPLTSSDSGYDSAGKKPSSPSSSSSLPLFFSAPPLRRAKVIIYLIE